MKDYQRFIHTSRYARWLDSEGRRETWEETVERYVHWMTMYLRNNYNFDIVEQGIAEEVYNAIINLEVMPSMRALMTAGPALDRTHVAGYNCAYLTVDSLRAFDEAMFILLCGTGVGFSIEKQYVSQLPIINPGVAANQPVITVPDSKEGWASSLRLLISFLYCGYNPTWDLSQIRSKGTKLKTFGGRASGPEPLDKLFKYVSQIIRNARGRQLTGLECHDILCKIAEIVVVGGVRRSAMISLSDLDDRDARYAKHGEWWVDNGQRALSNNSAVYLGRPEVGEFLREWLSIYDSKSGERGIFNRQASVYQASRNGRRRIDNTDFGTNPCSEIILRPNQFCNLSEVVVRSTDDLRNLQQKVRLATIIGTFQSTLTEFTYLRDIWRTNTEEERLLGVSLTGILDHPRLCYDLHWLNSLREVAVATNKEFASKLGINTSTAITCVKPSGTVSQLVDSSSGIHPRHSPYYIRTVRGDIKDPVTQFLKDQGVPWEPDVTNPDNTIVFSFPQKAPSGAICREELGAMEHLQIWKNIQEYWCEHKPSITVNVKEDEWIDVGAWVFNNFDILSGVAFLPYSEHSYRQAPYQEITVDEYHEWLTKMPKKIEWDKLRLYEAEDNTTGTQEYACSSGFCEIQ